MDWRDIMLNMGLASPTVTETNVADPAPEPVIIAEPPGQGQSDIDRVLLAISRLSQRVSALEQRDVLQDNSLHKLDTNYPYLGGNASMPGAVGNASMPGGW